MIAIKIKRVFHRRDGYGANYYYKDKWHVPTEEVVSIKDLLHESIRNNYPNYLYRLTSKVVHEGDGAQHGHYFSYLGKGDGLWVKANDTLIDHVDVEEMKAEEGTIFFYEQIDSVSSQEIYDDIAQ